MNKLEEKEKKDNLVNNKILDENNVVSNDEIQSFFLEHIAKLEEELEKIQNILKEKFQEQEEKKEIEERVIKAKNFFNSFFYEHDEDNPYVHVLFLEVLDILNEKGEKEIDYVEVLKLARKRFCLEMRKVLEEWNSEDIAEILGDQKLAEINETIMAKKKHVIEKPQYFSNDGFSRTDRTGRSNLLLK